MEGPMQTEKHLRCCNACAESDANGPGRQRAEEGQWFRLHGPSKTASPSDAGIIKIAVAVVDADVRRTMYLQPLLSQDKFTGMAAAHSAWLLLFPLPQVLVLPPLLQPLLVLTPLLWHHQQPL